MSNITVITCDGIDTAKDMRETLKNLKNRVLRTPRAIAVNIEIMRAFVRLREMFAANVELAKRLGELEARIDSRLADQDQAIVEILWAIRQHINPPSVGPKRKIGFV